MSLLNEYTGIIESMNTVVIDMFFFIYTLKRVYWISLLDRLGGGFCFDEQWDSMGSIDVQM